MLQPIDEFFDINDFAQAATYTPSGGSPVSIKVIFEAAFKPIAIGDSVYQSTDPMALCKSSDVSAATNDATLQIGATTFKVIGVEPDGTGITKLVLSKD